MLQVPARTTFPCRDVESALQPHLQMQLQLLLQRTTPHYATLLHIQTTTANRHAATTTITSQLRLRDTILINRLHRFHYQCNQHYITFTKMHWPHYITLLVHYTVRYSTVQYRILHYTAFQKVHYTNYTTTTLHYTTPTYTTRHYSTAQYSTLHLLHYTTLPLQLQVRLQVRLRLHCTNCITLRLQLHCTRLQLQ